MQQLFETILGEIRDCKTSQAQELSLLHQRLDNIETMVQQIPERFKELDKRVSDIEDRSAVYDSDIISLQKKLYASQNKIDEMENYARRSNQRFTEIAEDNERLDGQSNPVAYMES